MLLKNQVIKTTFMLTLVAVLSCRSREQDTVLHDVENFENTYIAQLIKDRVDVSIFEHIDPKSLFLKVGSELKTQWQKQLLLQMPDEVLIYLQGDSLGNNAELIKKKNRLIDRFVSHSNDAELNSFPAVPLEILPLIQKHVIEKNESIDRPSPLLGNFFQGPQVLALDFKECPKDLNSVEKLVKDFNGVGQLIERTDRIQGTKTHPLHSCYGKNSRELALLLNRLSVQNDSRRNTFNIEGVEHPVQNASDLISALLDPRHELKVEVYVKRVWVDFTGWHWKYPSGELISIRSPMWFSFSFQDGQRRKIPGEHSEVALLIYRDVQDQLGVKIRERLAHTKFYAGTPSTDYPLQAALWREKIDLDHAWAEPELEYAERFTVESGQEKLLDLGHFISATHGVQRSLQSVHQSFNLPRNGYGVFVCNDSVALTLGLWSSLKSDEKLERLSHSFPLVRFDAELKTSTGARSIEEQVFTETTIQDEYLRLYPSDSSLALGAQNSQVNHPDRLRAKNRFQGVLESMRYASPETRKNFPDMYK